MKVVKDFLKSRRKAELQTIHQFWFPGEPTTGARDALEDRLAGVLVAGDQLQERLARLSRTQRAFLSTVLAQPEFSSECRELHARLESEGILSFEVESAARMLQERGFVARVRRSADDSNRRETYEVPVELAERLGEVFDLARRRVEPADQISQKRLSFEIDFEEEGLDARVAELGECPLAELVQLAMAHRGVAGRSTLGFDEILENAGVADGNLPTEWRDTLENAGIGTIGPVSLKDFGILVEEPSVIIFQEWVQREARTRLGDVEEPDTLLESGVDLYIDIDKVARRLEGKPVAMTRDGRLPKRLHESLRSSLCIPRLESHLEGDLTEGVVALARRLGVLECYADELQVHPQRFQVWRKLDLTRQVESIQKLFLEESQGGRWSFHQEALRGILIEVLRAEGPEEWVSLEALVSLVVSTYLLELEEREVRETLRQRREEDFARERLASPFHRLGTDLVYWIVHRFLPLGVAELGILDGKLAAFRLTPLGRNVLGLERIPRESRILVNPNFEIILFCEGLRGMRLELELSRFGQRMSAERIRRYEITPETIREGIHSGLSLNAIRKLLEDASDHPLPEPVLVALRDWGKDLDWVEVAPAIVLRGLKAARAKALSKALTEDDVKHQLCRDHTVVIQPDALDQPVDEILDTLRDGGWLIRELRDDELDLGGLTSA